MRIENLLSPGLLSNAIELRSAACRAISNIEVTAGRTPGGLTSGANSLHAFFTDCASKIAALRDVTAPTVSSRTQAVGANTVVITTSEPLDPRILPDLTSFVTAPVRTITGVEIVGTQVRVTYSGASLANGNTIAYTQPSGANKLQDPSGNLLASFTAAAITVA